MQSFYVSDETVLEITNGGPALSKAQYIYREDEAQESFSAVIYDMNGILPTLSKILLIRGEIKFAVVSSASPFQVTYIGDDQFIVLVDQRAYFYLMTLCLRLESLPPLSNILGLSTIAEHRDYKGKCLLDITKDIVFRTKDVSYLLVQGRSQLLSDAALVYIISHEVAHISHGHLEFRGSEDFQDFSISKDDKNLTLRTLEMDADSSATSSVFDGFERFIDRTIVNPKVPSNLNVANSRQTIRRQYIAGMYIALIFMDTLKIKFTSSTHPSSYARFLTTKGVLETLLARLVPDAVEFPEQIRQVLVDTFIGLSGDIANLGYPIASNMVIYRGDTENTEYVYDPLGIALEKLNLEPLYGRWARLRPYLEKYQRGGRLAPAAAFPI